MNVFGIGTGELLLILVIALLVMGPERLPQLARQWGRFVRVMRRFTRVWQEINTEINRQINLEDMASGSPKPKPAPAPSPEAEAPNNIIAPPDKRQPSALQFADAGASQATVGEAVLFESSSAAEASAPSPIVEPTDD